MENKLVENKIVERRGHEALGKRWAPRSDAGIDAA
jgi:hypothetical protein